MLRGHRCVEREMGYLRYMQGSGVSFIEVYVEVERLRIEPCQKTKEKQFKLYLECGRCMDPSILAVCSSWVSTWIGMKAVNMVAVPTLFV